MAEIDEDQVIQDKINIGMTLLRELCKQESFKFCESKEQAKLVMTNIINDMMPKLIITNIINDMLTKYTGSEEFKATNINIKDDGKISLELIVPKWFTDMLNDNDEE